ncbi:MAG: hypothetical protein JWL90_3002 [Chthoniobacteraceae bacterium]|nr:hypothetical protein [Chthoniobacteraceae bacterium]
MSRFLLPPLFPRVIGCALVLTSALFAQDDPNRPVAHTAALSASATAGQMKMQDGFRVEVIAGEPDVLQPIAYTIDDRGRLWVVENTNYPNCPGVPKDKVLVFEDADHDGTFEKRTVFWDKATFTSGIAVGFGGVWLGSPPNLLFIPVKEGETAPAGEPEVMLDGWGNGDTHETLNDFIWGPDGWLYGTEGIFTQSNIGKPGTPASQRVPFNAGVWRFHPTRKVFESWCEGISNQWGIDWNDHGEAFLAACVIPHMWHGMEGAHYQRQSGAHVNPHLYEDIKTIAWGRYEKAAYCGAMVYLGGVFPAQWRDQFFFHDIHMNKMRCETMLPDGSGFRSERKADFLVSPDAWFRGLSPQYGPDGGVFINDWYDRVPCHQQAAFTDRTNGRIYKVVTDAVKPVGVDLSKASDAELVTLQLNPNDWYVRHARRLLQERGAKPETTGALEKILFENPDDTRQLRALWALHSQSALSEATAMKALSAASPHVRGWTATLLCENGAPSPALVARLAELGANDVSPLVRRRLASAAQRIAVDQRWPLLDALARHSEDASDRNLPLMDWYAVEGAVAADPVRGVSLLRNAAIPKLHEFIARRVTALSVEEPFKAEVAMEALSGALADAAAPVRRDMLRGMQAAMKGHPHLPAPRGWDAAYSKLSADTDRAVREQSRAIALVFGSAAALEELRTVLVNGNAPVASRRAALESLAAERDRSSLKPLQALSSEPGPLRASALRALAVYDEADIAPHLINLYDRLSAEEKREALNTLVARVEWTRELFAAIDAGRLPRKDLSAPLARLVQGYKVDEFNIWLEKNWGALKTSSADKLKEIEHFKKFLGTDAILHADVKKGGEIFQRTCAVCHTLFGKGGKIGPELPGSFTDLEYLLPNLLDPSAVIGKDYQQTFITTRDGQLHAGIVSGEDTGSVTLKTLADPVTIARSEIVSREVSPMSMMPEGLLNALSEPEVRDLLLYLRQQKEP